MGEGNVQISPLPWRRAHTTIYALEKVRGGRRNRFSMQVQRGPETPEAELVANAEFTLNAVNNHLALVATLQMTANALMDLAPYSPDVSEAMVAIVRIARDTIIEAGGEFP